MFVIVNSILPLLYLFLYFLAIKSGFKSFINVYGKKLPQVLPNMILIIDGYNVLKQVYGKQIDEKLRTHFIKKLQQYASKKGHHLIVIFDGYFHDDASYTKSKRLEVIYSGLNLSADDVIK